MMKNMTSRIALALALLVATVGTTTLHADALDRVAPQVVASGAEGGPTVRVMNNHHHQVRVYVVDSDNRRHLLGRVGHSQFKNLQIPESLTRGTGTVQLKVYPVLWSESVLSELQPLHRRNGAFQSTGVKTRVLSVQSDQVIVLYLEPDLTRSKVGIVSS